MKNQAVLWASHLPTAQRHFWKQGYFSAFPNNRLEPTTHFWKITLQPNLSGYGCLVPTTATLQFSSSPPGEASPDFHGLWGNALHAALPSSNYIYYSKTSPKQGLLRVSPGNEQNDPPVKRIQAPKLTKSKKASKKEWNKFIHPKCRRYHVTLLSLKVSGTCKPTSWTSGAVEVPFQYHHLFFPSVQV